jgi:hypothetical protein
MRSTPCGHPVVTRVFLVGLDLDSPQLNRLGLDVARTLPVGDVPTT